MKFYSVQRVLRSGGGGALLALTLIVAPAMAIDLQGTEGDDVLTGTAGDDIIEGLGGNDLIHGKGHEDRLLGGPGDDVLYGDYGRDVLEGGEGNDRLFGGINTDTLYLSAGDWGDGGGQNDGIVVAGTQGQAIGHGGFGSDLLTVSSFTAVGILYGDAGDDTLQVYGDRELDVARSRYYGGPGYDNFDVGGDAALLSGGFGNDAINAGMYMFHGRVAGGPGDDGINVMNGNRNVVSCGPGTDSVGLDPIDEYSEDCEHPNFYFGGTPGDDFLVGTNYEDHMFSGAGDDQIKGLDGNDEIAGGPGEDAIFAGAGDDRILAEHDVEVDYIHCGSGTDTAEVDPNDVVDADCEILINF